MGNSNKYDLPWDLISESLTGTMTAEDELQLQQWLSANPENKEIYAQIREMWNNRMDDYLFYKSANEEDAWKTLSGKLPVSGSVKSKVIKGDFAPKTSVIRRYIAIAAIFIGVIGFRVWLLSVRNDTVKYETAENVEKTVILADGSSVTLRPKSKIEVSHDYNKTGRTVVMISGKAYFDVKHLVDKPFVVELGITQVKDIGTSFTIQKNEKEINVEVATGKVAFTKRITRETRELSAGTSITYDVQKESFGDLKINSSSGELDQLLNFDNTPLADVTAALHKVYGKKVIVKDQHIADRKLTAHLEGMSYKSALEVICKSLGLEYADNDSVYVLQERKSEQH